VRRGGPRLFLLFTFYLLPILPTSSESSASSVSSESFSILHSPVLEQVEAQLVDLGFDPFVPSIPLARRLARRRKALREGMFVHALPGGREFHLAGSTDVSQRILRDIADESDIAATAFLQGEMALLSHVETQVLSLLRRRGARVRGVLRPSSDGWQPDLHRLVPWLGRPKEVFEEAPPPRAPEDLARFDDRIVALRAHPRFDTRLFDLLSAYIRRCVPEPSATEGEFWALTCLTRAYRDDPERKTLARLSVRRPEVLSVIPAADDADRDAAEIAFTVAEDAFERGDLFALSATCAANVFEGGFRTADFPHARLEVGSYADARRLLRHPRFIKACRLANLRLMRAGQLHPHVAAAHNHRLVQAALSRFPVR